MLCLQRSFPYALDKQNTCQRKSRTPSTHIIVRNDGCCSDMLLCLLFIRYCGMLVGDPVCDIEQDEYGRSNPHCPCVDIVTNCLDMRLNWWICVDLYLMS